MGVPGEVERENGTEGLFTEIVAEKFPNLGRDRDIDVQVVQRTPKMIITMITMRSIIIIILKVKDKNSESSKRKTTHHIQGNPLSL